MKLPIRLPTILRRREDDEILAWLDHDRGKDPSTGLGGVVRERPTREVQWNVAEVVNLDPVAPVVVFIRETSPVRREELADANTRRRSVRVERKAPAAAAEGVRLLGEVHDSVVDGPGDGHLAGRRLIESEDVRTGVEPLDARSRPPRDEKVARVDSGHRFGERDLDLRQPTDRRVGSRDQKRGLRKRAVRTEGIDQLEVELEIVAGRCRVETLHRDDIRAFDDEIGDFVEKEALVGAGLVTAARIVVDTDRIARIAAHVHPQDLRAVDPRDEPIVVVHVHSVLDRGRGVLDREQLATEYGRVVPTHRWLLQAQVGPVGRIAETERRLTAGPRRIVEGDPSPGADVFGRGLLETAKVLPGGKSRYQHEILGREPLPEEKRAREQGQSRSSPKRATKTPDVRLHRIPPETFPYPMITEPPDRSPSLYPPLLLIGSMERPIRRGPPGTRKTRAPRATNHEDHHTR